MLDRSYQRSLRVAVAALTAGTCCAAAGAAVTLLGVQYQQDELFPEYNCIWHDKNYPTSCSGTYLGGNLHVYVKNTGASSVTISDVTLAGYSLLTILPTSATAHSANSIYFYWDNPPADILAAGTPIWYKGDPSTIPAGGVAQAVIRLRSPPTTPTVGVGVVTTGGTVNATIAIDAHAPQLANVGFSQDRTKVYLHWRRSGGAAPTTVLMDGVDVTASTTTVGDPSVNFAESVLTLATPLPYLSYHVFQGVYADGKTATASLRAWSHPFLYASWCAFQVPDNDLVAGKAWIDDAINRGFNAVQNQIGGGVGDYLGTINGRAYADSRGYGIITWNKNYDHPSLSFINDEIDAEEDNVSKNFCGTGLKLPCGASPMGILGMRSIAVGEDFRSTYPLAPTTINMDGTFKPENYYAYGQAVDVLQVDPYYQKRLKDTYWYHNPEWIPLYNKATYNYAVAKAVTRAAEPNSSHVILQSCESRETVNGVTMTWPMPTPEAKRIEVYYSLAAGAKGISYWWFKPGYPSNGVGDQSRPGAPELWKEMGVFGNEIKTASHLLVISHPIDMTLTPGANVWARALAAGTDTIILIVVNDNYYNDESGCHYTSVGNATVMATLPTWMRSPVPAAFQIAASGLSDVTTSLNGSQLLVSLGTLNLTRMIIITTNPQLRAIIQQRYEREVWPGICAFAPEYCSPQQNPPTIVQQPSDQIVDPGGSTTLTVVAAGSSPLSYQWQKDGSDLINGGHYSGVTTAALTVSSADSADAANYRCVVANPYGTVTSNVAALTLAAPGPPSITQQPSNQSVVPGGTVVFTVQAGGTVPLSYQWQKDLVNLTNSGHCSGATTAVLTVSSADNGDAGNYRCVVTNSYGCTISDVVALLITPCTAATLLNGGFEGGNTGGIATGWIGYTRSEVPTTVNYTIQTVSPAEGLQYQQVQTSYVASGGAGVYQGVTGCAGGALYRIRGSFRTNSANGRAAVKCAPNGSTSYSSAIDLNPPATTTSTTWVAFSGTVVATASSITLFLDGQTHVSGSTAKAAAFDGLTVTCEGPVAPAITQQPTAQSLCPGGTTTFTVAATGSGTLAYRWQKNQVNLNDGGHCSGATTATLTISGADNTDAADYRCIVSNPGGSANSNPAVLTLRAATLITQHPSSQQVDPGGTATLTIAAAGEGTLSYQWQKNGSNLTAGGHYSGVTAAMLTVAAADGSDIANYRCVVTAGCGIAISNEAVLTIIEPSYAIADLDCDGDVDMSDFALFQMCFNGPNQPPASSCLLDADLDDDGDVDLDDFATFQACFNGPNRPSACSGP